MKLLHGCKSACVALAVAALGTGASAFAAEMLVDGKANIYGAGHTVAPGPGGGGGGILPPCYTFARATGTEVLTFSRVSGWVNADASKFANNGADGRTDVGVSTDTSSYGGISGVTLGTTSMFMVGVFLSDAAPGDPAPSRYNFTGATSFAHLYPQIAQTFFVGDGLTGTSDGEIQQFHVPAGATRFFLGFSDAWAAQGLPGWYGDNSGQLQTEFSITPEPASCILFGLAAIGVLRRR